MIHSIDFEAFAALDELSGEDGKVVETEAHEGKSRKRARLNDEEGEKEDEDEEDKKEKSG